MIEHINIKIEIKIEAIIEIECSKLRLKLR